MTAMKPLKRSLLFPFLAFSMPAFTLHAQAPAGGDPFVKGSAGAAPAADAQKAAPSQNCLLVLEVYALDKNDALGVLEAERGSAARYRRVTDIAKTGKARLEILSELTTKSGERASSDSIDEVRYPIEFQLPRAENGIAAPVAFETRSVGDTVEVEPVAAADGSTCEVNLVPQRVCLAGFRDVGGMADDAVISQPLFNSQKLNTSTTVKEGEPHYLGTFSPPTPQGFANGGVASEVWLAFLQVSLLRPPIDQSKAPVKPADWSAVNLEYTCYSLEREQAREILVAPTTIDSAWEKLQALVGRKKARFEDLVTIRARSGERVLAEEVEEFRYATGYAQEGSAGFVEKTTRSTITGPTREKQDGVAPKKEGEKSIATTETIAVSRTEPNARRTPGGPTAFETHNVGISVMVQPAVNEDGVSIDLSEVVQSVSHIGDLKVTGIAARYPAQPVFESRKLTNSQTLTAGRHALVGTLNPPGADGVNDRVDSGRTWVVFVRATPNTP
jgi:hypothetical protein